MDTLNMVLLGELKKMRIPEQRRGRVTKLIEIVSRQVNKLALGDDVALQVLGLAIKDWTVLYSRVPYFFMNHPDVEDRFFSSCVPWIIHASDALKDYALIIPMSGRPIDNADGSRDEMPSEDLLLVQVYDGDTHLHILVTISDKGNTRALGEIIDMTLELPSKYSQTFATSVRSKIQPCQRTYHALAEQMDYLPRSNNGQFNSLLHLMEVEFNSLHREAKNTQEFVHDELNRSKHGTSTIH